MRVGIIGLGLIGGSIGLALRRLRPELEVVGIARKESAAAAAVKRGAITAGGSDLRLAAACDLVIIATPLQEMRPVLAQLGRDLPAQTLLTDVGSTKAAVVKWAQELLPRPMAFLGGHPMAGRTDSGLRAADPSLFQDAAWIFTPQPEQDISAFSAWFELVDAMGARRFVLEPGDHDRRVALVSHLPFLLSAAYVSTVKALPEWSHAARIGGPGFRDMIRLAGGNPDMYAAITRTNRENILEVLKQFGASLAKFQRHLEQDDPRIWELFEESKRVHDQWSERPPGKGEKSERGSGGRE